jgi:gluconate 2-dehydrogenase gamma chain
MTERNDDPRPEADRRTLLKLAGFGIGAASLPLVAVAAEAQTPTAASGDGAAMPGMAMPAAHPADVPLPAGYVFLNPDEAAFVEAAVDTLIPADDYGPAGTELGVAIFVDRQLDGGYGRGDRMYLLGPFQEGTPEQGYQLPLTPSELVRAGIADVTTHVKGRFGGSTFDALQPADRVTVLTELEHGKIQLDTVPTHVFFETFVQLAMDGFFADPIYGGNKGKASWKMLGYPGVGEMYADKIEAFRNKPYRVDPKSIQDMA